MRVSRPLVLPAPSGSESLEVLVTQPCGEFDDATRLRAVTEEVLLPLCRRSLGPKVNHHRLHHADSTVRIKRARVAREDHVRWFQNNLARSDLVLIALDELSRVRDRCHPVGAHHLHLHGNPCPVAHQNPPHFAGEFHVLLGCFQEILPSDKGIR